MSGIQIYVKEFVAMTPEELYAVLRLRSEVFVVEQDCVYLDLDGVDSRAVHVYAMKDGECVACLRVFRRDCTTVQIGRVVTASSFRGSGLGRKIMEVAMSSLTGAGQFYSLPLSELGKNAGKAYLEAQTYATGFYSRFGFTIASEEFLEDGIPHVAMVKPL